MERPYIAAVEAIEELYLEHGDTHTGLGYPHPKGFLDRNRVYYEVCKCGPPQPKQARFLDIGCGTARLLDHLKSVDSDASYVGVDLSENILKAASQKHPDTKFILADPLIDEIAWAWPADYVVFGGLFKMRLQMSNSEMTDYMLSMIKRGFHHATTGIAFDVMSKHVEWEREDLYHVSFDTMAELLTDTFGRNNYAFRADYGIFEYTVYLYHSS